MKYKDAYKMMKWELLWKDLKIFISENSKDFSKMDIECIDTEFFYCQKYSRLGSSIKKCVDYFLKKKAEKENKNIEEVKKYYMIDIEEKSNYEEEKKWLDEAYPYLYFPPIYTQKWYDEKLKEIKEKYGIKD